MPVRWRQKIESYIVHTEFIQRFGNLNFFLCIEEGVGELLAFSQRTLDDFKRGDIAQVVGYRLVRIPRVEMRAMSVHDWLKLAITCCGVK